MADPKVPARYTPALPSVVTELMHSDLMPTGNHWFGLQREVIARNQQVVDNSSSYNLARARQAESVGSLIDARIRLARKYAEVLDLPSLIHEDQRQREHRRALAEHQRVMQSMGAVHELHLAIARHELEIAKTREQGVRAQRNLEAATRMKDVEVDRWYAEAEARRSNAFAERQDAAADLTRGGQPAFDPTAALDAAAKQRARDLETIDNQIELERERGNQHAILALMNLRARLKAA